MIEGGGSPRNYVTTKKMMYTSTGDWDSLLRKLVFGGTPTAVTRRKQVWAGADVIQFFGQVGRLPEA